MRSRKVPGPERFRLLGPAARPCVRAAAVAFFGTVRPMSFIAPELDGQHPPKSEEEYRVLVNNLGEGIGYVDPNEFFTFANPAAAAIFGVRPGELEGRCLLDFLDPAVRARVCNET